MQNSTRSTTRNDMTVIRIQETKMECYDPTQSVTIIESEESESQSENAQGAKNAWSMKE